MANMDSWESWAYYDEKRLIQECTCPACHVVWQHHHSKAWVNEHFSNLTEPIICAECGTPSVAGNKKRFGPRKLYVEPEPEPSLTRTERQRKVGWFRRPLEPAPQPRQKGAAVADDYQR